MTVLAGLGLGRLAFPIVLPLMIGPLGLNGSQSGLLGSGNFLGFILSSTAGGFAAARWGARRTCACGLLFVVAGLILTGMAVSWQMAMTAQFLGGIGTGAAATPAGIVLAAWFGKRYRGLSAGLVTTGIAPGLILSGWLLPVVAAGNWRIAWFALAFAVMLLGVVSISLMRDSPLELGLSRIGDDGETPRVAVPEGGSRWAAMKGRVFWQLAIAFMLFGTGYTAFTTFYPLYLVREHAVDSSLASGFWGTVTALTSLGALFWGAVSDRSGRRGALVAMYFIMGAAFLLAATVDSPAVYFSAPVFFWLTSSGVSTVMAAASGDYFGERLAFATFGVINTFAGIGLAAGSSLAGVLSDASGTFRNGFVFSAASALAGLCICWLLPRKA
jgi:MFS family permease